MFKPKKLHQEIYGSSFLLKGMIFKAPESPFTSIYGAEKRAIEAKVNVNTEKVTFDSNPDTMFGSLAKAAKKNPEEASQYAGVIKRSVEAHLKAGKKLNDLWDYLKAQGCTDAQIKDGILRFFNEKKQIPIHDFLELKIKAISSIDRALDKSLVKARNAVLEKNLQDRRAFFRQLKAQLEGKLPPPPSTIS